MSDDLERQLDDFYRRLDPAAERLADRWKGGTHVRYRPARSLAPWIAAGVAAAAVVVIVLAARSGEAPAPRDGVTRVSPKPAEAPTPERPRDLPDRPAPDPAPPREPLPKPPNEAPRPDPPAPPPEPPAPDPAPLRKPAPPPTEPERAFAAIREAEGTFDLGDKTLRGRLKDLRVGTGDRLKAATVTKLTLADDRFLLLAPKAIVEFAPEKERLTLRLESGDLLAELVGPGPRVRVTTKGCEIEPIGTVFAVRAEDRRTSVLVEHGRVECRGAGGKASLRAGQQAAVVEGEAPIAGTLDPRPMLWARGHRPPERRLFAEEFAKPGAWKAEVEDGVAKGIPDPDWSAAKIQREGEGLFDVPVRGRIALTYRVERAAKLTVQLFAGDSRMNFMREVQVARSAAWQTLVADFDDFIPTDKSKRPAKLAPGTPINEILLMYGESGEKITFWVDAIHVIDRRP
jgi:hypothetical protein